MMTSRSKVVFISLCIITFYVLVGCSGQTKRENTQLRERVKELETQVQQLEEEKATLQLELSNLKQTDNYYYQMAINRRQTQNYEESSKYLSEMLERFPKSQLGREARVLIAKNNEDLAKQLYDEAVVFQGAKRYADSNALADQIEARFPNSRFARQAKQLKEANKEKQREDQQAQEARLIAQKQAAARRGCDLELLSWNWYIEHGFAQAEGQVKNISGKNMDNVLAVVTFYDANGGFIKADNTLIEYNPILPGQTSPFKVMTTQNPAMKKASVEFKSFWGGVIRTYVAKK